MTAVRAAALGLACALGVRGAHADPPSRAHLRLHAAILAGTALAVGLSETVFKSSLAPAACRWCQPDGVDASVRGALVWRATGTASGLSDATALALVPASLAVAGLTWRDRGGALAADDALAIAESGVAAVTIDQIVKFSAGRERPFVHYAPPGRAHQLDDDVSFFSGHTAFAFALATSAGTIASERGSRWAPLVWGGGLALAAATGYLRIAADEHYLTDVLVGAAAGAALGVAVPRGLHGHAGEAGSLTLAVSPAGVALTGTF